MAVLLGTASASVTLDISNLMANARTAEGQLNHLAQAGGTGRGPTFIDRLSQGALGLGTALIAPMGLGLKAAVDLEQGLANVDAALGDISDADLSALGGEINDIAVSSQYSAIEIAALYEELAKAGVAQQDLNNTTQGVVNLAQATGDGLAPALQAVTTAQAVWAEGMVDADHVLTDVTQTADILTSVVNNTRASLGDINAGMRSLAPAAARAGLSYNEAAAAVGFFVDMGLPGADAGISLTRALTNLADPTSEATVMMNDLGIAAYDMEGNFIGFPALFDQLQASLSGMTQQQQELVLSTIFGAEAIDVMGIAALTGGDALQMLIDGTYESGQAAEQSAIRMDTLGAQFATLREGVTTLLGSLVSGLIPGLRLVVDAANALIDVLSGIPGPIKTVVGAVLGALAGFAAITRAIQGFQLMNNLLGGMAGTAGKAGRSMGVMRFALTRMLPLVGLAAVGFAAWESNIFGLRDSTKAFTRGFTHQWRLLKGMDFGPVGKSLSAVGVGLEYIEKQGGPLGRVAGVLGGAFRDTARFTDAFGNALEEVWRTGELSAGTLEGIPEPLQDTARGFLRVADAGMDLVRAFQEGGLQGVWDALPGELAQAASGFGLLWDEIVQGVQALDIPEVAINVAQWAFNALQDGASALWDWVTGTAIPAAGRIIDSAWSVTVKIAGWLFETAQDVWSALVEWWTGGGGGGEPALNAAFGAQDALPMDSVPVRIMDWFISTGKSIWTAIQEWWNGESAGATGQPALNPAFGAGTGESALRIPRLPVRILDWLVSTSKSIWSAIQDWWNGESGAATGQPALNPAFGSNALEVPIAPVRIMNWLISVGESVWAAIQQWWDGGGSPTAAGEPALNPAFGAGGGENALEISAVKVKILDWDVEIPSGQSIYQAINEAWADSVTMSPEDQAWLEEQGQSHGQNAIQAFMAGFQRGTAEGGGGGAGGGGELGDMVFPYLRGWFRGFELEFVRYQGPTLQAIYQSAQTGFAMLQEQLGQLFSEFKVDPGEWSWDDVFPDVPPIYGIQFVADFVALMGQIHGLWRSLLAIDLDPLDWDWAALLPEPEWPDWLTKVPDWWTNITEGRMPWDSGTQAGGSAQGAGEFSPALNPATGVDWTKWNWRENVPPGVEPVVTDQDAAAVQEYTAALDKASIAAALGQSNMTGLSGSVDGLGSAFDKVSVSASTAATSVGTALNTIPTIVQGVGTRAQFAANSAGTAIATGFSTGAAKAPALVGAALAGVPAIVSSIGTRAAFAAYAVGANIGNAMAAGMRSALGAIQSAANAMVSAAEKALVARAMISSPSRLFMQLGEYVGEGFVLGVRSMIPDASLATASLVRVPNMPAGSYATNRAAASSYVTNNAPLVVNVTVEGNVTTEQELIGRAASEIWRVQAEEGIRQRLAAGMV